MNDEADWERRGDLELFVAVYPPFVTIAVSWRGRAAGHAKLVDERPRLKLGDIYIFERKQIWWLPKSLQRKLRGRGIGSALLGRIIRYADQEGYSEIYGEMVGDLTRLPVWYRKHGFEVNELTHEIRLELR